MFVFYRIFWFAWPLSVSPFLSGFEAGVEMSTSVETVNAAATAIVAAESRVQQVTSPRRRWGGCFSMYWCFGSQRQDKRILEASTAPGPAHVAPENPTHPSPLVLPFVAPPSSPASFLQSEPPSVTHSPVGLFSLTALSSEAYSPGGPTSIFAIGPYAHETQLVSPPVFSTFTTEPSTAPLTPPEPVHLTTPSSPEVPFAQLLMTSLDSNLRKGEAYGFQSYQWYPGSPIGHLVSPGSVCSGTSSPFPPDMEFHPSTSNSFPSFPMSDPPKLLIAEGLAMRKMVPHQLSGKDGLVVDNQIPAAGQVEHSTSNSCAGDPLLDYRVSFELDTKEVASTAAKEQEATETAKPSTNPDTREPAKESLQPQDKEEKIIGCYVDETYHDLPEKLKRSLSDRVTKEFKFNNADGAPSEPTVGLDWWANEKIARTDTGASKKWAFFPISQTGVS